LHRGSGEETPNNTVGSSIGRNAGDASAGGAAVGFGGRRVIGGDILPVGENIGFHLRSRHPPINKVGDPVTVDSGGGISPAPDGRHRLDDIVGGGTVLAHTARVGIHHVKIAGLVRAEQKVGMGHGTPGSGQETLSRRAHVLVPRAHGGLALGREIIQRGDRVGDGIKLQDALSKIRNRG